MNVTKYEDDGGLEPGDQVELLSGGPVMTLKRFDGINGWNCQWFAGEKLQNGFFAPESLRKIERDDE